MQKNAALAKIRELNPSFSNEIVTEISAYTAFYPAEAYHQDYEKHHPFQPYILQVSKPKIERVRAKFRDLLKEE